MIYVPKWLKSHEARKSSNVKDKLEKMRAEIKKQTTLIEQAVAAQEVQRKQEQE